MRHQTPYRVNFTYRTEKGKVKFGSEVVGMAYSLKDAIKTAKARNAKKWPESWNYEACSSIAGTQTRGWCPA